MQDDLTRQYLASINERIEAIKILVREYRAGDVEIDRKIRLMAHSLHGSGATFGFPEISVAAKEVELAEDKDLIRKLTLLVKVLKDAPAKASEAKVAVAEAFRILLIDDDADNALMIREALQRKPGNYEVVVAETAAGGEEQLVKHPFSLILLDLVLPDRDGREILREIKIEYKLPTPVFVLSAIERDTVRVECMSMGADKFFLKPYDPHAVALAIDAVLRKGAAAEKRELSLVPLGAETAPIAPVVAASEPTAAASYAGKSVLVAEDDTLQAANLKQRLSREGLSVDVVDNGQLALDMLAKKSYSLVILDVRMPMLDGFAVLMRIRGEMKLRQMPVIMLTAMGSEAEIIKGYDLGADDYILKPYSTIQLVARVKSLLKRR
ncbi:MAG: Alkaline phosphatase synthesis transcriptional regulatory protein PhoP [Pseudomonadota bacterium]|jgi:DNA-binding response OmpR family regulator